MVLILPALLMLWVNGPLIMAFVVLGQGLILKGHFKLLSKMDFKINLKCAVSI